LAPAALWLPASLAVMSGALPALLGLMLAK